MANARATRTSASDKVKVRLSISRPFCLERYQNAKVSADIEYEVERSKEKEMHVKAESFLQTSLNRLEAFERRKHAGREELEELYDQLNGATGLTRASLVRRIAEMERMHLDGSSNTADDYDSLNGEDPFQV